MSADLQKLRIDKGQKARHDDRSAWPWVVLILLLAGGGVAAWQYQKSASVIEVETVRVRVPKTEAAEGDLVLLNATGYIMAAHRIELASKVLGRVASVRVEMGDKVKAGDILVTLEDDEYKAMLAQQKGQLDSAKARLAELRAGARLQEIATLKAQLDNAIAGMENAKSHLERTTQLRSSNLVSQEQVDDDQMTFKTREAQVESARQQLELMKAGTRQEQIDAQEATVAQLEGSLTTAKLDLGNTVIRAPMDSTILERNVEVGEFVTTGFVGDRGAKGFVVSIADLNDLLVELDISQNDFAKVAMSQPCWIITDAYPDRKYEGVVQLISPVANRQKATVQVRVKVSKPDSWLKPDMNATVSFLAQPKAAATQSATTKPEETKPAVRIPAAAVHDGNVFIMEDGKALRRAVTLGRTTANGDVEVTAGLRGGEDLIMHSTKALQSGDPVRLSGNTK